MRLVSLSNLSVVLLVLATSVAAAPGNAVDRVRLADYLAQLSESGARIIYSGELVTDDLLIDLPGPEADPMGSLPALLEPFGLAVERGPAGHLLIVGVKGDENLPLEPARTDVEPLIPQIIVTSSLHRITHEESGVHTYLEADVATRIPVMAEEIVRLTQRLPGTASGGISARSHVRGGEANEVLFLFDGLRLYEPYHMRDFQSVASIVNSGAVAGVDFYTGAYPAHFGDRMSGVLVMEMREAEKDLATEVGLSFFNTSLVSMGRFGEAGEGDWLFAARRGNLDLLVDVIDPEFGSPDYHDQLAHVSWEFGPRALISSNILFSKDKIFLSDAQRGEEAAADYRNRVGWLKWGAEWSGALRSDTLLAVSDILDRRDGVLSLPGIVNGTMNERRELQVFELRQDWRYVLSDRWMWSFGATAKHLDGQYRHVSTREIEPPFDAILANEAERYLDFDVRADGAQYAAYSEVRWRMFPRVTLDLGIRWDQQSYTIGQNDRQYSPRASALLRPNDSTDIRLGWGQYYQAQETNELQFSDGIAEFFPAQRAEHFVLNVAHRLRPETRLEAAVFRKSFRTLRPRFENVFNTRTLLPELQFDRVMIEADKAEAFGAEFTLTHGESEEPVLWWVSYGWARTRDSTDEGKIHRSWDQEHSVKAGFSWLVRNWSISATGEWHSGWPTTLLTGEQITNPDGSSSLVLSTTPRNSERLGNFASVDVRVNRSFEVSRGKLDVYLEISNLLDHGNPCCMEYALGEDGGLESKQTHWLPLVPSVGVLWRF